MGIWNDASIKELSRGQSSNFPPRKLISCRGLKGPISIGIWHGISKKLLKLVESKKLNECYAIYFWWNLLLLIFGGIYYYVTCSELLAEYLASLDIPASQAQEGAHCHRQKIKVTDINRINRIHLSGKKWNAFDTVPHFSRANNGRTWKATLGPKPLVREQIPRQQVRIAIIQKHSGFNLHALSKVVYIVQSSEGRHFSN